VESDQYTIEVDKLYKRYGKVDAVNGISFSVRKGQIVGFLGPNGAGKSTTMRVLTGYARATSGVARICGIPVACHPHEIKRRIGYMPENNPLPLELRVSEYLKWRAKLKELPARQRSRRIDEVLERCDLTRARDRIIGKLSKGFRQRVGIADAILAYPDVIIMDEPTIGLDPHQVILIRDLIASLRGKMSVIISSHILPEIEMTCDQIIIINGGKIVGKGTPDELRRTFIDATTYELEICGCIDELRNALRHTAPNSEISRTCEDGEGGFFSVEVRIAGNKDYGENLFNRLANTNGIRARSIRRKPASLEEVFIAATRRSWETVDAEIAAKPADDEDSSTTKPENEQPDGEETKTEQAAGR